MKMIAVTATLLLAALADPAFAQKLAPGLWEHAMTMKSGSGQVEQGMAQMQQELARMPPEQRKMVEQMMASRGVGVGAAPGAPTTLKLCITPEQAARDEMPQHDGRCKQTSMQRSGNTMRFTFACSGEPPSSGEGEFTLESPKAHSGKLVVTTTAKGKPERMEMQTRGRWLAADCGGVKPRP